MRRWLTACIFCFSCCELPARTGPSHKGNSRLSHRRAHRVGTRLFHFQRKKVRAQYFLAAVDRILFLTLARRRGSGGSPLGERMGRLHHRRFRNPRFPAPGPSPSTHPLLSYLAAPPPLPPRRPPPRQLPQDRGRGTWTRTA